MNIFAFLATCTLLQVFFVFYSAHWRKNIVIVVDFDMALHLFLNFDVYFQAYAAGGGSMVALM